MNLGMMRMNVQITKNFAARPGGLFFRKTENHGTLRYPQTSFKHHCIFFGSILLGYLNYMSKEQAISIEIAHVHLFHLVWFVRTHLVTQFCNKWVLTNHDHTY
jgi:hypothetical protein